MYQEILEKKMKLEQRRPFSPEVNKEIHQLNRADMVYSALKLDGSQLDRDAVEAILDGELVKEASIHDYTFIRNYSKLLSLMENSLELGNQLTSGLLLGFHKVLVGESQSEFRRASAMIDKYRYVPIHPSEVEENLSHLFTKLYRGEGDVLFKAAHLHNYIIMIYPFEQYSELFARVAMNYYLMEESYPPIALGYAGEEYFSLIKDFLKNEDHSPIRNGLERAVFNKLEVLLQMTEK